MNSSLDKFFLKNALVGDLVLIKPEHRQHQKGKIYSGEEDITDQQSMALRKLKGTQEQIPQDLHPESLNLIC